MGCPLFKGLPRQLSVYFIVEKLVNEVCLTNTASTVDDNKF